MTLSWDSTQEKTYQNELTAGHLKKFATSWIPVKALILKKKNRTFVRSLDITLPYRSKCLNLIKLCLDSTSSSMNLAALLKQGTFGFQTHEHLIKLLDKYIFSLWQKFFIHFFVMTRYTLTMNSENWPCIY